MLNILKEHPVSRMPSLHFTYALYKEHENTFVNGHKVIKPEKGGYIINPQQDLKIMELRMTAFFNYWKPDWKGMAGIAPSAEEFKEMLATLDIFSYSGHGNGSQYLSGDKIQNLRTNAVILLFGCSSSRLTTLGPQVEMVGIYQMYMIACR